MCFRGNYLRKRKKHLPVTDSRQTIKGSASIDFSFQKIKLYAYFTLHKSIMQ